MKSWNSISMLIIYTGFDIGKQHGINVEQKDYTHLRDNESVPRF
jgi:hypothetical protein